MYLIETDIIYSLLFRKDTHNRLAHQLLEKTLSEGVPIAVSTLALVELDLTTKSNPVVFSGPKTEVFERLTKNCRQYGVEELSISTADAIQSICFREKYGLTFFDSYYAAQAHTTQCTLVSFDKVYSKVKEITHKTPEEILSETT